MAEKVQKSDRLSEIFVTTIHKIALSFWLKTFRVCLGYANTSFNRLNLDQFQQFKIYSHFSIWLLLCRKNDSILLF